MKAVVEMFGGNCQKVFLTNDEVAEEVKTNLEKKAGITTQEERESRALNGKEEYQIVDVDTILKRGEKYIIK